MTTIRRFQPTPAFVVAIIALVVSMSGTAVAVTALAPNSVKSKHIANGQVKAKDLGSDSVRGAKVKDTKGFSFEDDSGWLEWAAKDRGVLTFRDAKDVRARSAAVVKLVARWMEATR